MKVKVIERFRKRITSINLVLEEDRMLALKPETIKKRFMHSIKRL